jgi:uracil DNA glycosylase
MTFVEKQEAGCKHVSNPSLALWESKQVQLPNLELPVQANNTCKHQTCTINSIAYRVVEILSF